MRLQTKLFLLFFSASLLLTGVMHLASSSILNRSFIRIEEDQAKKSAKRVVQTLSDQAAALGSTAQDWATWDDSYQFVQGNLPEYPGINLSDQALTTLHLNLIVFTNAGGKIIHAKCQDGSSATEVPCSSFLSHSTLLYQLPALLGVARPASGLFRQDSTPFLLALRPILHNDASGPPAGTLMMGYRLDTAEIGRLSKSLALDFSLQSCDNAPASDADEGIRLAPVSASTLIATAPLADLFGKTVFEARILLPREVFRSGQGALIVLAGVLIFTSILFVFLLWFFLHHFVFKRLLRLSSQIATLPSTPLLPRRVDFAGHDEIGSLSEALNRAFESEESTQREFQEQEKELQKQLRRAESMEAAGLLAGGVAHDLNNILGPIVFYPELIAQQAELDPKSKKWLGIIRTSAQKAAAVVQDMLSLGRRGIRTPEPLDLAKTVADFMDGPEFAEISRLHPLVQFHHHLPGAPAMIPGSASHLLRLLMNLVSNGADAIKEEGKVTVWIDRRDLTAPLQLMETVPTGNYWSLHVVDTGEGIPPGDRQKVFEPFFTRKILGRKGTGLGLPIVWAIVKDHGGFIDLAGEPGRGAAFEIFLPVLAPETVAAAPPSTPLQTHSLGGRSILVVDDVQEQRDMIAILLQSLGCRVATAPSGEAALGLLREQAPDFLVTDMIMEGGMDGFSIYEAALRLHPGLRAVIISGFAETDRVKAALQLGPSRFLRKPFTPLDLHAAIAVLLDK